MVEIYFLLVHVLYFASVFILITAASLQTTIQWNLIFVTILYLLKLHLYAIKINEALSPELFELLCIPCPNYSPVIWTKFKLLR